MLFTSDPEAGLGGGREGEGMVLAETFWAGNPVVRAGEGDKADVGADGGADGVD